MYALLGKIKQPCRSMNQRRHLVQGTEFECLLLNNLETNRISSFLAGELISNQSRMIGGEVYVCFRKHDIYPTLVCSLVYTIYLIAKRIIPYFPDYDRPS